MSLYVNGTTGSCNWPTLMVNTNTLLGAETLGIVAGWYYINTFTAGRYLWSNGAARYVQLYGSSELEVGVARFTTARFSRTTGAGITTGSWFFIAAAFHDNNSTNYDEEVWVGTPNSAPTLITTTNASAGSGFTVVPDNFRVGSGPTGSNNVDAYISNIFICCSGIDTTSTSINTTYVYDNYIEPIYRLGYDPYQRNGRRGDTGALFGTTSWTTAPPRGSVYIPFDNPYVDTNNVFPAYSYGVGDLGSPNGIVWPSSNTVTTAVYSSFEPTCTRRRQLPNSPMLNTTMRRP